MNYISCFSGIGGLEASTPPAVLCESDPEVCEVLSLQYPEIELVADVQSFSPPQADLVAGGWPCQDISVAGQQAGLAGLKSRLLIDMLKVARKARASIVVAENVPNLLRMNSGLEFAASLRAFHEYGYEFIAWRVLNARSFGLPQHRNRLLLVASKNKESVYPLFRSLPELSGAETSVAKRNLAAGFYWTAGIHSLNYSRGYVPTIKVGSSLSISSPPAVHIGRTVRQLTPSEALRLQGFQIDVGAFSSANAAFRAAGNAVPRPMGRWVMDGILGHDATGHEFSMQESLFDEWRQGVEIRRSLKHPKVGLSIGGKVSHVEIPVSGDLSTNLIDFLDSGDFPNLSRRAANGLLERLKRSGQQCPADLLEVLEGISSQNLRHA